MFGPIPDSQAPDPNAEDPDQLMEILTLGTGGQGWFEENMGQIGNPDVRFSYSNGRFSLGFVESGYILSIPDADGSGHVARITFQGSSDSSPKGRDRLPQSTHHFLGNGDSDWVRDVPGYRSIIYRELYPGIDLVFYSTSLGLKYDFHVAPGGDPSLIRMSYEGVEALVLDGTGSLHITFPATEIVEGAPYSYQSFRGEEVPVSCRFRITGRELSFDIGNYDHDTTLVIDPLLYSTYLGGSSVDEGYGYAMDSEGNIYVAGYTKSADFPNTTGAYDESHNGGRDVFVSKFNPEGTELIFSTYVGGSKDEGGDTGQEPLALAVDDANNVYVAGHTHSDDFPTTPNCFSDQHSGGETDLFVFKLNAEGSDLMFSTYMGGSGDDVILGAGIALDSEGNAIITGHTESDDFPTTPNCYDDSYNGNGDAVILKLNHDGFDLLFSSYLGGGDEDGAVGIVLDDEFNVYMTGFTTSDDFPATDGVFDDELDGVSDAFAVKFTSDCSDLVYSTLLGGDDADRGHGLFLDPSGFLHLTGKTTSVDFPTSDECFDDSYSGGGSDAFVSTLNENATELEYSTFLGGKERDEGRGINRNPHGEIYVIGVTWSSDFPTTPDCHDSSIDGQSPDGFLSKFTGELSELHYSTFIGGGNDDDTNSILLDTDNNAFITGYTASNDFPTTPGSYDDSLNGDDDAFIFKLNLLTANITGISPNPAIKWEEMEFSGKGMNGGNVIRYYWTSDLDGVIYSGADSTTYVANLSVGEHNISLKVKDSMGYWSDPVITKVMVHKRPVAYIDSVSPDPALEADNVTFEGHGKDDGSVEYYSWRSSLDGVLHSGSDANFSFTGLSNGTHTIYFKVRDNYGAWSREEETELRVNGIPRAVIESIHPNPATEGDEIQFAGNASDDGSIVEYNWTSSLDGFLSNARSFVISNLSNGTHFIYFEVKDNESISSQEVRISLTINGIPRAVIEEQPPDHINEGEAVWFRGKGTDDGNITEYNWTSSRDGFLSSEHSFSTSNLSNGTHNITFQVKDDGNVSSKMIRIQITVNGIPRAIIESSQNHSNEGDVVWFVGNGTDDGNITEYNWSSNLDGFLSSENSFSTSNLSNGTHNITFKVKDDQNAWSRMVIVQIIVNGIPTAIIESGIPLNVNESEPVLFAGSGTDDGTIIEYHWESNLDGNLSRDPSIFISNLSNGSHTIHFKVKDNVGVWSDPVNATIEVNGIPRAWIIDISPNPANVTDEIIFVGNGIDDDAIVEFAWESSIDGFLNHNSSFSTSSLSVGTHSIHFKVKDDMDAWSITQNHTLTINRKPTPELFVWPSSTSVLPGETVDIMVHYNGVDGDVLFEVRFPNGSTMFTQPKALDQDGNATLSFSFQDLDSMPTGLYSILVSTSDAVNLTNLSFIKPNHRPEINEDDTYILTADTQAFTSSNLSVVVSASDQDDDPLSFSFLWYVNGKPVGLDLPFLQRSFFEKGDQVYVNVSVSDGKTFATADTLPITIQNSPPHVSGLIILPLDPTTVNNLKLDYRFQDIDDDPEEGTTIIWYMDRGMGWEDSGITGREVPAESTMKDQQWKCWITPSDGEDPGNPRESSVVTIHNSKPEARILSPDPEIQYFVGDDIQFDGRSSIDLDHDDLSYQWKIDGFVYNSSSFQEVLDPGTHSIMLTVGDGMENSTRRLVITINDPLKPDLFTGNTECYITNLDSDGKGRIGKEISFTVFVWNRGDIEATATVDFYLGSIGGNLIGSKSVRVPSDWTDTAFITWNPDEAGNYTIYAVIVDSDPTESDESNNIAFREVEILPKPIRKEESTDGSAFVVMGTVGLGAFGVAVATYEPWKFRFFALFVPLYTRLNHEKRMDNENRSKILGFIIGVEEGKRDSGGQPGVSYSTIKKKLKFSNGALAYHLSVLEREGDIRSDKVGKYRLYFPAKIQKPKTMFLERLTELQQRLIEEIKKHTEVSQKRLVRSMRESQQVISYNLNRLEQKGIIFLRKRGNSSYCRLNPEYLKRQDFA